MHTFGRYGNQHGQFQIAHDVVADDHGGVDIGDAWGERVQKFECVPASGPRRVIPP